MKRFDGKSAIVTGAASAIGRATNLLFTEHGAKVMVVDRALPLNQSVALA